MKLIARTLFVSGLLAACSSDPQPATNNNQNNNNNNNNNNNQNTTPPISQYPVGWTKINQTALGLTLSDNAKFGIKASAIGDINNDGITDIAVGATNQNGSTVGSVFVIRLKADGTVLGSVEIPNPEPELDSFGSAVAGLGDLDNDGVEDIAVGAGYDSSFGAVWILFLNTDGTVKSSQKINDSQGGFTGSVSPGGNFGTGMAGLGDLDGDGKPDLAVGADLDGGTGSVFILFLNANGTVKSQLKIANNLGGLTNILLSDDYFGYGLGTIGDLNKDGVTDIFVGAHRTDDGGVNRGAFYVLFLNTDGTVKSFNRVSSSTSVNFNESYTSLGLSGVGIGDIDNDTVLDIVVGSNDTNNDGGVIWYLAMNTNGTVKSFRKYSTSAGGTGLALDPGDFFGASTALLGDLNKDGHVDIGIGAFNDDDQGTDKGAIYISK